MAYPHMPIVNNVTTATTKIFAICFKLQNKLATENSYRFYIMLITSISFRNFGLVDCLR